MRFTSRMLDFLEGVKHNRSVIKASLKHKIGGYGSGQPACGASIKDQERLHVLGPPAQPEPAGASGYSSAPPEARVKEELLNLIIQSGNSHLNDAEHRLAQIEAQLRQIQKQLAALEAWAKRSGQ